MNIQLSAKEHAFINTDGQCYLGTITIAGQFFHVEAIRVHDVNGEQEPIHDPYDKLNSFYLFDERGRFNTVKIDGLEGEFIVIIFPHQR